MSRQFVLMCETGWKNSFDRKNYFYSFFFSFLCICITYFDHKSTCWITVYGFNG